MSTKPSILPSAVTFEGDIEGEGDLVVFGRVAGSVRVSGALVIEAVGEVRGDLHGGTVTVRGTLVGNATGAEAVWVDASARVVGDLAAPRIKVVEGAAFRGRVHLGELATRAPGALAVRGSEALVAAPESTPAALPAAIGPAAHAATEPSAVVTEPGAAAPEPTAAAALRLPRMPRVGRASGTRRAAL